MSKLLNTPQYLTAVRHAQRGVLVPLHWYCFDSPCIFGSVHPCTAVVPNECAHKVGWDVAQQCPWSTEAFNNTYAVLKSMRR